MPQATSGAATTQTRPPTRLPLTRVSGITTTPGLANVNEKVNR